MLAKMAKCRLGKWHCKCKIQIAVQRNQTAFWLVVFTNGSWVKYTQNILHQAFKTFQEIWIADTWAFLFNAICTFQIRQFYKLYLLCGYIAFDHMDGKLKEFEAWREWLDAPSQQVLQGNCWKFRAKYKQIEAGSMR